ncbi:putative fasciclin-like arabinogalactan protein [Helianthus annuus]|uniref:Putative FASCICLIN-like arabinogalactan 2 n=1 Tax=Helianthus annuus TaxID=4232 RepID=A0A251V6Z4_HELAN|nr:putative fasciclin-like arabinogalactan protein [Helianthus annuus]KAJ0608232.1 putative fasciclin-like arabinogalactan protein [Helianthus annuus]KAJ0768298.1 putative fasciclin-like arabinogalactan protein [Helianthus annuus]KAJ0774059.1 putative fasciclin-like arabinogalactan protein [Helianthus annuus]
MPTATAISLSILFLLSLTTTIHAHNITRILAKHPEFSTFNHYLTITHLANEINRRQTITVCAVDNAAMSDLLSKGLSIQTIKNVLSLHVFADYFGSKKLHQVTKGSTSTATMYQATGEAPGTAGYVHITDVKGGKVRFTPEDNLSQTDSVYVKSILEMPYNISVIQISSILQSPEAEAPTAAPDLNLTSLLDRDGCQSFHNLLTTSGAIGTFLSSVEAGVTVFCPDDDAITAFAPKYKNLTAAEKTSLLLYHGIPVYNSMGMLRSSNGLMNTLATEGAKKKYDFTVQNDGNDVKLKTKVVTATVTGTVVDDEPIAIYTLDKVLQPRELFKGAVEEADEPAPAPKGAKKKKKAAKKGDEAEEDAEAPGPGSDEDYSDDDAADQTASSGERVVAMVSVVVMAVFDSGYHGSPTRVAHAGIEFSFYFLFLIYDLKIFILFYLS